jgi:hypothetical protein
MINKLIIKRNVCRPKQRLSSFGPLLAVAAQGAGEAWRDLGVKKKKSTVADTQSGSIVRGLSQSLVPQARMMQSQPWSLASSGEWQ